MKTILITGANKGIGLAIAEAILREKPQYRVLLCARNIERGEAAKRDLFALDEAWVTVCRCWNSTWPVTIP